MFPLGEKQLFKSDSKTEAGFSSFVPIRNLNLSFLVVPIQWLVTSSERCTRAVGRSWSLPESAKEGHIVFSAAFGLFRVFYCKEFPKARRSLKAAVRSWVTKGFFKVQISQPHLLEIWLSRKVMTKNLHFKNHSGLYFQKTPQVILIYSQVWEPLLHCFEILNKWLSL